MPISRRIKFIPAGGIGILLLGLAAYPGVGWSLYDKLSATPRNGGGPGKANPPRFIPLPKRGLYLIVTSCHFQIQLKGKANVKSTRE